MSAPLTNSPLRSVPEWRKRSNMSNNYAGSSFPKQPTYNYYYILASESSTSEDEGSESVDNIQGRATDYCRDTTDTDSTSEQSGIEYEIVNSTDHADTLIADRSSSGEICGRMCRVRETVSCVNFCSHCYQIRKTAYPPKPRRKHQHESQKTD